MQKILTRADKNCGKAFSVHLACLHDLDTNHSTNNTKVTFQFPSHLWVCKGIHYNQDIILLFYYFILRLHVYFLDLAQFAQYWFHTGWCYLSLSAIHDWISHFTLEVPDNIGLSSAYTFHQSPWDGAWQGSGFVSPKPPQHFLHTLKTT